MSPNKAGIKPLNDISQLEDFPISLDAMNRGFDEYVENNGDKIELNKETFPSYDPIMMKRDSQLSDKIGQSFEQDMSKKLATLLEKSIYYCGEQQNWFGDDVSTVLASDYDDYINGIDVILEFNHLERNFLGVAADITYRNDASGKFGKIKANIDKGWLSMIKYYNHADYNGSIKNLPKVIIEIPEDELRSLAKKVYLLTCSKDISIEKGMKSKLNEDLENSPLQYLVLLQSLIQLMRFRKYAQSKLFLIKKGKIDGDEKIFERMIRRFDQNISIIASILGDKLKYLKTKGKTEFLSDSTRNNVNGLITRKRDYNKYLGDDFFKGRYADIEKIVKEFDFVFRKYPKVWGNIVENFKVFD